MTAPVDRTGPLTPVIAVPLGTLMAGLQITGYNSILFGWSVFETTGAAPALVQFFNGADARGILIADVPVSAGQGTRDMLAPMAVAGDAGLFCNVVSGSVRVVVWISPP